MRIVKTLALFLASLIVVCGQTKPAAPAAKKSALDKPTLEAYLRHMEMWLPQVQVKIADPTPSPLPGFDEVDVHLAYGSAVKDETYYVSKDGQKIIKGTVHDINQNPFQSELSLLKTDLQPSFGAPGATVVIVVFGDFECPLCREEAQVLRQEVTKAFPTQVRVYFRDYPLDSIHPWARSAAIAGRCLFRQNPALFWEYHDWIYAHQTEITPDNFKAKLLEFAGTKGVDALQLGRCFDGRATEGDIDASVAMGRALQVDATPTMFLNGRKLVGSIPWQSLEQIIKLELDYQKVAADAGEKCCEVKIPSPIK
jgi:protein-disulfide isomerase